MPVMGQGQQVDIKKVAEQSAEMYLKGITETVMPNIHIDLPEQFDLGLKNSAYQFKSGTSIHWKTRDPFNGIEIRRGNQNYQINQTGLAFGFSKQLDLGWFLQD